MRVWHVSYHAKYIITISTINTMTAEWNEKKECDLLVHDILMTSEYYQKMEFTLPWTTSVINFIVPSPNVITTNTDAIVKPFQWPVINKFKRPIMEYSIVYSIS